MATRLALTQETPVRFPPPEISPGYANWPSGVLRGWFSFNSPMFDWYPHYEYHLARAQLVLFTLGMGMTLSLADFVEIARRPRSFFSGLIGQLLVVPFIAVLINWLFQLQPGIAVGMILVAAMPGGALAKFFTYFGRGNMALSISLTGVTTLLTLVTVPLMLQLLATQHIPPGFTMPVTDIVIDVAVCLWRR